MLLTCCCCILIAVPAVVVPVVLLSDNNNNDDDPPKQQDVVVVSPATPTPKPTSLPNTPAPTSIPPTQSPTAAGPENDFCIHATPFSLNELALASTTTGATWDGVGICGATNNTGPGVWYALNGTGETLVATTCNNDALDTQLTVFRGIDCANLQCVAGNDDTVACGRQSMVAFDAVVDERYWILVHGFGKETGDFELSITRASSDTCNASALLSTGTTTGTTWSATLEPQATELTCNDIVVVSPTVWYRVTGSGVPMTVSTCVNTAFDTILSVYTNTCDALQCVASNDDGCDRQSRVSFETRLGQDYYILVHGFNEQEIGVFSLSIEPSNNDNCSAAIGPLLLDDPFPVAFATLVGSTLESTTEDALTACPVPPGNDPNILGLGVWYFIRGTGTPIVATTCSPFTDYDTQLSVFTGSSCGDLQCIATNDDGVRDTPSLECELLSVVSWQSELDVSYWILVHGFDTEVGEFGLTIQTTPDNDDCIGAVGPLPILDNVSDAFAFNIGTTILGSTENAMAEMNLEASNITACGNAVPTLGVWYYVDGTGGVLNATTCSVLSSFDTQLSVYTSDSTSSACASMQCVDGDDDGDDINCGVQSLVSWQSESGRRYWILVHGFDDSVGNFALTIQQVAPPLPPSVENDLCVDAIEINVGGIVMGSTASATFDNAGGCQGVSNTAPGVWYLVRGDGQALAAHTCDPETDFDTELSLYTTADGCNGLQCLAANDQSCGGGSAVLWNSTIDQVYYILVHGFMDQTGNFALTVEPVAENDVCANAVAISSLPVFLVGTTISASIDQNLETCGTDNDAITGPGVWYVVPPQTIQSANVTQLTASTCTEGTALDTKISIFAAASSCANLQCITGNDQACGIGSVVAWNVTTNNFYYILVHGFQQETGDFELTVEPRLSNDDCLNAIPLRTNETILTTGSTLDATVDTGAGTCDGVEVTAPGLWYSVIGTGEVLEASTCFVETAYDTKLSVYTAASANSCQGTLTCVVANDDSCDVASRVVWLSQPNQVYYLLVHGFDSARGAFGLLVQTVIINDQCDIAGGPIPLDGAVINGFVVSDFVTDNAVIGNACGDASHDQSSGIWYTVNGTGEAIVASTCFESTDIDTQISVFTGSDCNTLQCVDGNNDACFGQSIVQWQSQSNVMYYIYVHAFEQGASGAIGLQVVPVQTVDNDSCQNALSVNVDATVILGSTLFGTVDANAQIQPCDEVVATGPGIWYVVQGTGQTITALTCFGTTFDTKLSVYTSAADCEVDLTCVAANDDNNICGLGSIVQWASQSNTIYYILVHGYNTERGPFGLVVQ